MTASLEWSVAEWLTSFGMKELTPKFLEHGYETEKLCSKLQAEDMEAMCINNPMQLEVIYTQSEMLRKKREEKIAVGNGQAPAFVPRPSESTDGTSTNLQLVKHKVRKIPAVQQQRKTPDKIHVPPPESQRTFAGYTKLQLKLKIKEEIRKDHIVLSEPPYCLEVCARRSYIVQVTMHVRVGCDVSTHRHSVNCSVTLETSQRMRTPQPKCKQKTSQL